MHKLNGIHAEKSEAFDHALSYETDRDYSALRQELASIKRELKSAEASKSEMLGLLCSLTKIVSKRSNPADAQEIEAEGDRHIAALRSALGKLAKYGKSDVFVAQVLADMGHLASVAVEAANKGILRVTEHHFASSQMLLDAFGESERVLRYTWRVNPSEQLFRGAWPLEPRPLPPSARAFREAGQGL
jgi:hypothetical protein